MIARKNRFHGHNSLRPLYQKNKSVYSTNIKLLVGPAQKQNYRAAVVVSKKVHKSAVVRNRIRRRVYEYTRLFMADAPKQYDFIFIVQTTQIAELPAPDVKLEVESLLKKAISSI